MSVVTIPDVITLDRPLIGVDLETTSTNFKDARIVEIGLEIMRPGEPTKEWSSLVNPGVPIPPGATAIHHITDEMVLQSPRFEDLADNLLRGLTACDFCGYNVRFDLKILAAEFARHKRAWSYDDARVVDGFRLWQHVEQRSLSDAIKHWAGPDAMTDAAIANMRQGGGGEHDALWDIRMSTRVIAAQLLRVASLPRNLQGLHDLCNPGFFDAEGKLRWKDGELCISFGEHRDKPLRQVPRGYLKWMSGPKAGFGEKVKTAAREAADGRYPEPPASLAPVEENDA